jgi:probable rRNA maturation factor
MPSTTASTTPASTSIGSAVADPYRITFSWQRHPGGRPTAPLRRLAAKALELLGHGPTEIGVLVADDATVRSLNRRFRSKDQPTDVLSFPADFASPEGAPYLGDVAISLETARRQAAARGVTVERELAVLLLHALIHLTGHDHETDDGEMEALEGRMRRELLT